MSDQTTRCRAMGINAVWLTRAEEMTDEDKLALEQGSTSVVFTSPEALLNGPWLSAMKKYRERVCLLAFDEAHCLSEWGEEFRPDYKKAASLRSVFTDCPCLALSATVTEKVLADITSTLHITDDVVVKALLPDRPNIYLDVRRRHSYDIATELEWLAACVEAEQDLCAKTLIFAHSINNVADIYAWLIDRLREKAFRDGRADNPLCRYVSMFHAHISESLQQYTLREFAKPESTIRVLVCTVAFGMGVEISDVRQVIHWGKVPSLMAFWQEVGRCGRDGKASRAIWYPKAVVGEDKAVLSKIKAEEGCVRLLILQAFKLPQMSADVFDCLVKRDGCSSSVKCLQCTCAFCSCCSYCRAKCKCFEP